MSTGLELLPLAIAFGAVAGRRRNRSRPAEGPADPVARSRPERAASQPAPAAEEEAVSIDEAFTSEEPFAAEEAYAAEELFPVAPAPDAPMLLETRCTDERLLVAALRARGSDPVVDRRHVHADIDGLPVLFVPTAEGPYDAQFPPEIPLAHAQSAILALDETYVGEVHRDTLRRVLEHAAENGMAVEDARTDADGTAVLTLRHGEVRIRNDATIAAETRDLFGDECLPYRDVFERLLRAQTVDWRYTDDYTRSRPAEEPRVRPRRQIDVGDGS